MVAIAASRCKVVEELLEREREGGSGDAYGHVLDESSAITHPVTIW